MFLFLVKFTQMNIRFLLRDTAKKDGSYKVRAYIQHNGRAYYNTKYSVFDYEWNDKAQRFKEIKSNASLYNAEIIRLRNEIESICIRHPNMKASEVADLIGKKSINTFPEFFEYFIKDCETGKLLRSLGTVKIYRKVLKSINEFEYRSDFDCINRVWYENYTNWLRTREKNPQNENTVGSYIKVIKMVMREAFERGISTNIEYQKKYFKQIYKETDSIYLTEKEIKLWAKANLSQYKHLQPERDRFLIQYYLLLRFGDTLRFNESNFIKQGKKVLFKIRAEKTLVETVVPVNPKALELLKKYNFVMNTTTNQESNRDLKEIGRIATITEVVNNGGVERPKFNFITTHTARRSGATNLFLQGCPEKIIMDLGGWKNIETFRKYIRLNKLESAKKALDFKFFK